MSTQKPGLARREFLKKSAATGAALGGAALVAGNAVAHPVADVPRKWDDTCDVLIVGSGFAGLAAALEAKAAGADVLLIEKMPVFGGNSAINGGDFAAPGTKMQKEAGVEDSPELMLKDMLKAGASLNHPELARIVATQAADALQWCEQYVGCKFFRLNFHGGHSVKRAHQVEGASGAGLVTKMIDKARSIGVKLETRAKLVKFFADKSGRIVGAEVARGYKFPDDKTGKLATIRARRGIVLAAGGFSNDVALRQIHDPRLTARFDSTNQPGATGEALSAASLMGAAQTQMDWIQLGPWTSPDEKGFGYVPQFCERLVGYGPMVNPKSGKRFFKETGNRKERADAIIAIGDPVVILGDEAAVKQQILPEILQKGLSNGSIKKFDTLEALAQGYGMPAQVFLEEVKRWNGYVEQKKDPDFDCMIFKDAKPTASAPFYAARLWPRVHHTMGGLVIDANAQVIGFDLKPVKGLYAAGEATGGVHGAVRLGSVAMSDCVVFGRIAGKSVAKERPAA